MNHVTLLDAGFLEVVDADRHVSMAIGGLAVVEGPAPDQDVLMAKLAQRVRACPRFGQRLRLHPLDLGPPEWVDDPDFDVGRHVRRIAVPQPGDNRELFEVIADLMARRLERDRPLWEIWIIEGLVGGKWAILTQIHHCMADAISATHILAGLCDGDIRDSYANDIRAVKESRLQGPQGGFSINPLKVLGGLWNASSAITAGLVRASQGAVEIAAGPVAPGRLVADWTDHRFASLQRRAGTARGHQSGMSRIRRHNQ